MPLDRPETSVVIGKITSVHGIKGWVKVFSYTDPMINIFEYPECYLKVKNADGESSLQAFEFDKGQRQGKGLVAHIKGVDDRDEARKYSGLEIAVLTSALPELDDGDVYWHQLEGCDVYAQFEEKEYFLGRVSHLINTGANDVLVVRKCSGSVDRRERLIPWVPEQFVKNIDIAGSRIDVDWDPEF